MKKYLLLPVFLFLLISDLYSFNNITLFWYEPIIKDNFNIEPYTISPVIYNDKLIVFSENGINSVNSSTGKLHLEKKITSSLISNPVIFNNKLVWADNDGNISFYFDNGADKSLTKIKTEDLITSDIIVCNNYLVFQGLNGIYWIDTKGKLSEIPFGTEHKHILWGKIKPYCENGFVYTAGYGRFLKVSLEEKIILETSVIPVEHDEIIEGSYKNITFPVLKIGDEFIIASPYTILAVKKNVVLWKKDLNISGLNIIDDKIVLTLREGKLLFLDADGKSVKETVFSDKNSVYSSPYKITDNLLFVGGNKYINIYDMSKKKWSKYYITSGFTAGPILWDSFVYLISGHGFLYKFKID